MIAIAGQKSKTLKILKNNLRSFGAMLGLLTPEKLGKTQKGGSLRLKPRFFANYSQLMRLHAQKGSVLNKMVQACSGPTFG